MKHKLNKKKFIFDWVGYSVLLTNSIWLFVAFFMMVLSGKSFFFENIIFISIIELIFVLFGLIFILYKLAKFFESINKGVYHDRI